MASNFETPELDGDERYDIAFVHAITGARYIYNTVETR